VARNMDKWLGDGGMELLGELGVDLTGYGEGWVEGTWIPTPKACNPNGPVHGGVSSAVADAVMAFSTLSALDHGEYCTLLEMKISYFLGAVQGDELQVRGEVVHMGRSVAFCQAIITRGDGKVAIKANGTILLQRAKNP